MASLARLAASRLSRPCLAGPARMVQARAYSEEISDADFDAKWVAYFSDEALTSQEIRRGLNDVFAHDLIPDPTILTAALHATRRVDDFPTSVRIFEAVKDKAPDTATYDYVVGALQPTIDELG